MTITLKPVTIAAFDIAGSVGRRGKNDGDDILSVRTLLNGIGPNDGGADGTLDSDDNSERARI